MGNCFSFHHTISTAISRSLFVPRRSRRNLQVQGLRHDFLVRYPASWFSCNLNLFVATAKYCQEIPTRLEIPYQSNFEPSNNADRNHILVLTTGGRSTVARLLNVVEVCKQVDLITVSTCIAD